MSAARCLALSMFVACCLAASVAVHGGEKASGERVIYARFQHGDDVSYGIVEGERIRRLEGDLFGKWSKTDETFDVKEVKFLVPSRPTQVIALAGNYKSHIGAGGTTTTVTTTTTIVTDPATGMSQVTSKVEEETRSADEVPKKFQIPQVFFKSPSCLIPSGEKVVLPPGATDVHYEAELVVVIGKTCKNVSKEDAHDYILGVTCGNDISERVWQKADVQWWRAKGSDTFGPCGPVIVSGLDYDNLLLEMRHNGNVVQKESTRQLIHDVASTVSFISQHVTLHPGDLIYTGTPGETKGIQPGDVLEVKLEGVGVLRNEVASE